MRKGEEGWGGVERLGRGRCKGERWRQVDGVEDDRGCKVQVGVWGRWGSMGRGGKEGREGEGR